MGIKADDDWDHAAREFIRADIERRFEKIAERAAKSYGITGANLSSFLSGRTGIGPRLMRGVCRSAGVSLGQLVGEELAVLGKEDPYPNRTAAINFLRSEISQPTIHRVLGGQYTGPDRTRAWWVARISQIEEMVHEENAAAERASANKP